MKKSTKKVMKQLPLEERAKINREISSEEFWHYAMCGYDLRKKAIRKRKRLVENRRRKLIAQNFKYADLKYHPLWYITFRLMYKLRMLVSDR